MAGAEQFDWSRHVVDHVELRASDYAESVRFYETVLDPLEIPSWPEDTDEERVMCFTRVNVVDRTPATTSVHLCFVARSREQVDGFHAAGVAAGYRSNGTPGYREYAPGTTPRFSSIRTATTSRRSIGTRATRATRPRTWRRTTSIPLA